MEFTHPQENNRFQQASELLRAELLSPRAQKIWAQYLPETIRGQQPPVISYRAVARALANEQHRIYGVDNSPNRYKDRVRRAILGQRLTQETLELFAETFDFSPQQRERIGNLIAPSRARKVRGSVQSRDHFIIPTSTLYDIHLDSALTAYKIKNTMVIRALAEEVDTVWAANSEDIARIELIEGGTSSWDGDRKLWKFTLCHTLEAQDCLILRYNTYLNTAFAQEGLITLSYSSARQSCSYRLFFDDPSSAPSHLSVIRNFSSASASPFYTDSKEYKIPVYSNRASFYLDNIYREAITFKVAY